MRGPERQPDGMVLGVGIVLLILLLPLVLGLVGYAPAAFAAAFLLLAVAVLVRPSARAAPLRWLTACLGFVALLGGVVDILR